MTLVRTACPLDCPDGCSITVDVVAGRLVSVDATPVGDAANPFTAGFICQKVKHHAERVYGPDRILTPLIRTGAKGTATFRQATWDEAVGVVATAICSALAAHGPGSVVPYLYNSSGGVLAATSLGDRVCAELGLAHVEHTICAATFAAAKQLVFGSMLSADPLDVVHSRYIVVWGANPTISNTHLPPLITQAVRQHGARLVVVDPRRTALAGRAHRHLAVRPGTDVVLAAAMARHLHANHLTNLDFLSAHSSGVDEFLDAAQAWTLDRAADITGVAATDIAATAEEWATCRPAMLRVGWGMERNRNGGSAITTVMALPVLMGHFGERGAGIMHSTSSGNAVDASAITRSTGPQSATTRTRRSVSQNHLGTMLNSQDGNDHIEVLIVQGANPALMNLDQRAVRRGLLRPDLFTVVHEQVMTDTARYADVVLPATTHFESPDIASPYGSYVVQPMPAVIDRVGESRTNAELWAALGEQLGVHGLDPDPHTMMAAITTPRPLDDPRPEASTIQMVHTMPSHADGRFHLTPPVFVGALTTTYPLTLLSPASNKLINSIFGERHHEAPTIHIHPDDCAPRAIHHGQTVVVHNQLAHIELIAHVTTDMRPGVVSVSKGSWSRAYGGADALTVNALIPAEVEPLAGGACFNDARVDVRPAT